MFDMFGGGKRVKPLVLHVDDDSALRVLFGEVLAMMGVDVLSASHGQEGLESARKNSPNLIILDVQMPGINGFEVVLLLKRDPKTAKIPVLMMTTLDLMKDVEKALTSGADDYLVKPVDFPVFKAKVLKFLVRDFPSIVAP